MTDDCLSRIKRVKLLSGYVLSSLFCGLAAFCGKYDAPRWGEWGTVKRPQSDILTPTREGVVPLGIFCRSLSYVSYYTGGWNESPAQRENGLISDGQSAPGWQRPAASSLPGDAVPHTRASPWNSGGIIGPHDLFVLIRARCRNGDGCALCKALPVWRLSKEAAKAHTSPSGMGAQADRGRRGGTSEPCREARSGGRALTVCFVLPLLSGRGTLARNHTIFISQGKFWCKNRKANSTNIFRKIPHGFSLGTNNI